METNRNIGKAIVGIVFIIVGIAFVGRTFNFFPHRIMHHLFSWPMILVVLGVILVSSRQNKTTGWILLIIGLVILIPDIIYIPYPVNRLFWPLLLISFGVFIIFRSTSARHIAKENNMDYIDDFAVFGGGHRIITSDNFKGGKITGVFGGSKIDLSRSLLAPGRNLLDIFCIFGGTTIIVPDGWTVKVEVTSVFGGFSDKRHMRQGTTMEIGKELIVKGFVLFGGGELKS